MELLGKDSKQIQQEVMRKRLLVFVAIIFLGFILWSSLTFQQIFYKYVSVISGFLELHPFLGGLLFVALAAISALLSLFSSVPLVPVAVVVFGNLPTVIFLLVGWMLGGIGSYFIGASAGYAAVKHFVSLEEVKYYQSKLYNRSSFWLIVAFRMALPAEVTGYTLGTVRYHFGKYVLSLLLSELPFALLAAYSSQALIDRRPGLFISLVILCVAIIVGMFIWMRKKMKK